MTMLWRQYAKGLMLTKTEDQTLDTHRFTGVNIREVGFQLLHCPVLETINSLVGILLVRCLDDKNHRDVHNTWIHAAKPCVFRLNMNLSCPYHGPVGLFPSCAKRTKITRVPPPSKESIQWSPLQICHQRGETATTHLVDRGTCEVKDKNK